MLLTPDYWLSRPEFYGVEILDPDGWDRANFETSWSEPITREEMERRLMSSTVQISPDSPLHPCNVAQSQ
jgi:hypothetical protein